MAAPPDPILGMTLGSFKVTRVIGRGGMGTVYLGEHAVIGSRVAIKVLQERLASDEGLVARFYAEARAVNLIGHDNIVNIFDMNVAGPNRYYLVMEYLEGKPLNALLTRAVPTEISIPILLQVCDALQAAHAAGIVHRDLKPENIFLIKRGRTEHFVKVLDFGLAKLLDQTLAPQHTAAGLIVGTPEFMSPEQANSAPVDGRSDIYSLGCIGWLLATGKLPFPQRGLTDLLVAHRQLNPDPPNVVNPAVPRGLSNAIMKAMAKNPAERFQDAKSFAAALDSALQETPGVSRAALKGSGEVAAAPIPTPERRQAGFQAQVATLDGKVVGTLPCKDLSKGGMFLCTEGPFPAAFSRLKITLDAGASGSIGLLAEVVRTVPPDQAKAWGMLPGFGVQFLDMTPQLRDIVGRTVQGLPPPPAPPPKAPLTDDVAAETVLSKYRQRVNGDHYMMLGVTGDMDFGDIRAKARDCARELEALRARPLSDGQKAQLDAAMTRIKGAVDIIGSPIPRAEYDANRGNHRGVARAISAGMAVTDLEKLRNAYLAAKPGVAGSAHVRFLTAKAYEARGDWKNAIDACEAALQQDPLNLLFQQRYAYLNKKSREAAPKP
jgi:tRNA A-37 threonylcarbamoyl transferase component Bud32